MAVDPGNGDDYVADGEQPGSNHRVAVFDILEDNARTVQKEIEALGGESLALRVDLTSCREVNDAV